MKGSLYPDGVTVDRVALRRTELTKAEEILRNRLDWTSRGVYTGFEVSINGADDTKIDIAKGSGFAPNGEFIDVAIDQYSLVLDDYTLNVVNWVCAVYTESNVKNQPHESDGQRYPTEALASWRIRIFSDTNYGLLPNTDSNLANNAKDRCLVVGKVTANGIGVSLTVANIQSPTEYNNILYASPSTLATISGVTVMSVSTDTPVGDGTLQYNFVAFNHQFIWTTSSGAGVPVLLTVDGIYDIPDGASAFIRILVNVSQLPTVGLPLTETITIINLYYQAIPRLTAEDSLHRNMTGTGIINPHNPHGLSLEDISGDSLPYLEEHQDVMHCNGIWKNSSANIFITSVTNVAPVDVLNIIPPAAGDLYYINGKRLNSITSNILNFTLDLETGMFEIYIDDDGVPFAHRKASYPAARTVQGTWIVDMSQNYPLGIYQLSYQIIGLYTVFTWASGLPVYIATATLGVVGGSRVIRLYAENAVDWIDLWINGDDAPSAADYTLPVGAGPTSDNITVTASPDLDQNMQIASVVYWYDALGPTGELGYPPYLLGRKTIDKRPWGTLCEDNMSDSALQNLIYAPNDELQYSGVLLRRNGYFNEFQVHTLAGLDVTLTGGSYYCRGQRLTTEGGTVTLIDNTINLVWLDMQGVLHVIDVTADFGGVLRNAMKYVLGSNILVPATDNENHSTDGIDPPERGVILYQFDTAAGVVTNYQDMMRNINGPVDPWSVAYRDSTLSSSLSILFKSAFKSAFSSLYSAFAYADYEFSNTPPSTDNLYSNFCIEIKLVGYSLIDRLITQPANVNVRSVIGGISIVFITYQDIDGAWQLEGGTKVSDVTIYMDVNNSTAFVVKDFNVIENCVFYKYGHTGGGFISLYKAGWTGTSVSNIKIIGNKVTTDEHFIRCNTVIANGYNNILVENNVVDSNSSSIVLSLLTGSNCRILGNKIETLAHGHANVINIRLAVQTHSYICNNTVIVGDGNGVGPEVGILVDTCTSVSVSNNSITRRSGSSSVIGYAINFLSCNTLSICENRIYSIARGVMGGTLFLKSDYVTIQGNVIKDVERTGIYSNGGYCIIKNNTVRSSSVGIAFEGGGSSEIVVGNNVIYVTTDPSYPNENFGGSPTGCYGIIARGTLGVLIEGNDVRLIGFTGILVADSACIYLDTCGRFTVQSCRTKINVTAKPVVAYHIVVFVPSDNFSILNNHVDNRTGIAVLPSPCNGIYVYTNSADKGMGLVAGNCIDGSNILDLGPPLVFPFELYVEGSGAGPMIVVKGNYITDVTQSGVYPAGAPNTVVIPAILPPTRIWSDGSNITANDGNTGTF